MKRRDVCWADKTAISETTNIVLPLNAPIQAMREHAKLLKKMSLTT